MKCHKLLDNASNAGGVEWNQLANPADQHSVISPANPGLRVAPDAPQPFVTVEVVSHKTGKSHLFVSNAGKKNVFHRHMLPENTAQELALIGQTLVREVEIGKVELHLPKEFGLGVLNGKTPANQSGNGILENAEGALSDQNLGMFTTSDLGKIIPKADSTQATLCCSVLHAIAGSIPNVTLPVNFCIDLSVKTDWTLIRYRGKPSSDAPRYKSLGNSMAVPVIRWLGQQIMKATNEKETEC
jgi:hypothetical protein